MMYETSTKMCPQNGNENMQAIYSSSSLTMLHYILRTHIPQMPFGETYLQLRSRLHIPVNTFQNTFILRVLQFHLYLELWNGLERSAWLKENRSKPFKRPCHRSGGYSLASHVGGPGSILGQVMWDLWWTKWHWGRFSPSISLPPANSSSTDCSTVIIYHLVLVQ
jgi:hypothetical protein